MVLEVRFHFKAVQAGMTRRQTTFIISTPSGLLNGTCVKNSVVFVLAFSDTLMDPNFNAKDAILVICLKVKTVFRVISNMLLLQFCLFLSTFTFFFHGFKNILLNGFRKKVTRNKWIATIHVPTSGFQTQFSQAQTLLAFLSLEILTHSEQN